MVSAIESVTVGVDDLDAALTLLRHRFQLTVVRDTRASVGLLAAWRRPVHESVRLVELGTPGRASGYVRLAQFEGEIRRDVPEAQLVVGPRALGVNAEGKDLLLTAAGGLPIVPMAAPVATLSVVTDDIAASERFYTEALGWHRVDALPRGAARLFGQARGVSSRMSGFSASGAGDTDVVVGHFPDRDVARLPHPGSPGRLGINLCTCRCDDLDEIEARLAAIQIEPVTRPTHVGLPIGLPGRIMLVRGAADELFELVELVA